MENMNASQASSEVEFLSELLAESLQEGKALSALTNVIQQQVQIQLDTCLSDFHKNVSQLNLAAIEAMYQEITKLKEESVTVQGVMERLKSAVAPDLPEIGDEVVSFRQAINNLERYGSIIPSSSDIANAKLRARSSHAWDLFSQAIAKLIITKLGRLLNVPCSIS